MPDSSPGVITIEVEDILIAGIRFQSQPDDIPLYVRTLYKNTKPHICGKPIFLYHGGNQDEGLDMEVCFPVSREVTGKLITSRILEGGRVLCLRHIGPYGPVSSGHSLMHSWSVLWDHVQVNGIQLAEGPGREVYLENSEEHRSNHAKYVTELMLPLVNSVT